MQTLIAAYSVAGVGTMLYMLGLCIGDLRLAKRQRDLDAQLHSSDQEVTNRNAA